MTDLAQLEMRIHNSNNKLSRLRGYVKTLDKEVIHSLRGDVASLKDRIKELELQLKLFLDATQ